MSSEDTGDSSSQGAESPYSSPSQQVPHLSTFIMGLSCAENSMDTGCCISPFLTIKEQPNNHFRFRYISELLGTHGCIVGKSSNSNRTKTYPMVELMNYRGKAMIKCRLAQYNNDMDHPHQLVEDEQDSEVKAEVGPERGYTVSFQGMGIIHMAKKDVALSLYKKMSESRKCVNNKELKYECEVIAKKINLNIVRLKFSAHNIETDEEICPPVFSDSIHNMKSAATNDLKICRMSRSSGKPTGSEDVFILTEKVNKKNIEVRFVELDSRGEPCWTCKARFLQSDVHHQYAIVFRTPTYKHLDITSEVKVYVELYRPTDGRTSERVEFTYMPELHKQSKKRKNCNSNSFSSFGSSGGSLKSIELDQIPKTVAFDQFNTLHDNGPIERPVHNITVNWAHTPNIPQVPYQIVRDNDLSDALLGHLKPKMDVETSESPQMEVLSPMLGQPNVPEPPVGHYVSGDIERLLETSNNVESVQAFLSDIRGLSEEYFLPIGGMADVTYPDTIPFLLNLESDSGRGQPTQSSSRESIQAPKIEVKTEQLDKDQYKAFYSKESGEEVKKIVKELCDMIRNKAFRKDIARTKLERLFELRLSNGDTFLHLTLHNNILPSMEYIVKLVNSLKMTYLLNEKNHHGQTILHQAVINDLPDSIPFLVSKGCDPMSRDVNGNNVIHNAVICQTCLSPLLDAIKRYNVSCDLNAFNKEKHTALHLAVVYRSRSCAALLLKHGASPNVGDNDGRTPLHVAAYDSSIGPATAILQHIDKSEVDTLDRQGHSALQIVCGSQHTEHTLAFVELLLKNGADPLRNEPHNESAWKLARGNPQIRELMTRHVPSLPELTDDDIKSEPEDEFESADEGDTADTGLEAMSAYIHELADILDRAGTWRQLATRLQCDSLLNWFDKTPSPTKTLLAQVKECQEEVTSVGLAKILRDMGEFEAADVILRYVDV